MISYFHLDPSSVSCSSFLTPKPNITVLFLITFTFVLPSVLLLRFIGIILCGLPDFVLLFHLSFLILLHS